MCYRKHVWKEKVFSGRGSLPHFSSYKKTKNSARHTCKVIQPTIYTQHLAKETNELRKTKTSCIATPPTPNETSWQNSQIRTAQKTIGNNVPHHPFHRRLLSRVQTVTYGRVTEVPKLHALVRELAFCGNFISVLKPISARNLKNTLKPSKDVIWR